MANRRMFSKDITNSSEFMMLSQSAQALYFHLGMNGDDDGFVEIFTLMRMTESKPEDLRQLHERGFIYCLDSRVAIIKDWHEHNQMRTDRYKESKYLSDKKFAELYAIIMADKIKNIAQYQGLLKNYEGNIKTALPTWQPNGNQLEPQDRLGKVSILGAASAARVDEHIEIGTPPIVVTRVREDDEREPKKGPKYLNARTAFKWFPSPQKSWQINTTELKHGELLFERGEKAVRGALAFYDEHRDDEFCPKITKPSDLERKWRDLLAFKRKLS